MSKDSIYPVETQKNFCPHASSHTYAHHQSHRLTVNERMADAVVLCPVDAPGVQAPMVRQLIDGTLDPSNFEDQVGARIGFSQARGGGWQQDKPQRGLPLQSTGTSQKQRRQPSPAFPPKSALSFCSNPWP